MSQISYKEPGQHNSLRYERMHVEIMQNSAMASVAVAEEIAELIQEKARKGGNTVLGLLSGSSPIKVYEELVRMHKQDGLSFRNVIVFSVDEYCGLEKNSPQSHYNFLNENLFKHVDILPENINFPDANAQADKLDQACIDYEMKIKSVGGLDFVLLGIGRTGHIGFNEPGSYFNSKTRVITLDYITRSDVSQQFHGQENVPRKAITTGVSTILKAARVVMLAWGEKKAEVIKRTVEGDISPEIPATYLQAHKNCTIIVDEAAAENLTRQLTPWLVGSLSWTPELERKAVIWLSNKVQKPILKLTDRDYNENFMSSLISREGSAYDLNIKFFNILQHTITGWPGGKPNADDSARPERKDPEKKRVLVFSPHPDDAVICMGGTLRRLIEQEHDVTIAIQTSGSVAVGDMDALRSAELSSEFYEYQNGEQAPENTFASVISQLKNKREGAPDPKAVSKLKALIRRGELLGSTRYMGIADNKVHFMDLPFYETGTMMKNAPSKRDSDKMAEIIKELKPHQIFAAGDLDDPHGTQRICLELLFSALAALKTEEFMKDCRVWLYRGAWAEWKTEDINMAVPLSPNEVEQKKRAIFFHETSKNGVVFLGEDKREFWQRADDRNKNTAEIYRNLGFSSYEAMEAFHRHV